MAAQAETPATREFMLNLASLHGDLDAQADHWSAVVEKHDDRQTEAMDHCDELVMHMNHVEQAMLRTTAQSLLEFAAKVAVLAQPHVTQDEWLAHLRDEARALIA